jgi:hypothetical protein
MCAACDQMPKTAGNSTIDIDLRLQTTCVQHASLCLPPLYKNQLIGMATTPHPSISKLHTEYITRLAKGTMAPRALVLVTTKAVVAMVLLLAMAPPSAIDMIKCILRSILNMYCTPDVPLM